MFTAEDTANEILEAPEPSVALQERSLQAMLDGVRRKNRRRRGVLGALAVASVIAMAIFGTWERHPTGNQVVGGAGRSFKLVRTQAGGFTTGLTSKVSDHFTEVRTRSSDAMKIIRSPEREAVAFEELDDAALLAMFKGVPSILFFGDEETAPRLVVAQVADAASFAGSAAARRITWYTNAGPMNEPRHAGVISPAASAR